MKEKTKLESLYEQAAKVIKGEKYPDVRNSFLNATKLNGCTIDIDNDTKREQFFVVDGSLITEAVDFTFEDKGGIIVFSTDVNAAKLDKNRIVNFLKQKLATLKNRLTKNKKITDIMQSHKDVYGFSLGNFFRGRYKTDKGTYDERSASVEIIGISPDVLVAIAEDICRAFNQETVLVKDYASNKIMLVNGKNE